jgi:hypothetical protein
MKKFTFMIMFLLPFLAFGQTTLVTWNFPNNSDDSIADGGIPADSGMYIKTYGGTGAVTFPPAPLPGGTTNCASAAKWTSGNGLKYWQIKVVTLGYSNILLSSKQYSSGTGPRDFKAQYSTDSAANWYDFAGDTITVASNWTTGVLSNVHLPPACDNKDIVFIRWIMTSDSSVNVGETVKSTGTSKIDDIFITGQSGTPLAATKLSIVSVNGGTDPYVSTAFDVVVNSLDLNNNIANVTSSTNVLLSLVTGTGSLGGTLSGTIPSGASSVTIAGVTYNTAESGVSIQAADQSSILIPDTSGTFSVLPAVPQIYCDSLLSDDFTDGDFTNNPAWTGDIAKFKIDASPQKWLQLDGAGVSETVYLSTGNNISMSYDTIVWEFLTNINYNTSVSNNARFYLMSDSAKLTSTLLKGYYIQLGGEPSQFDSITLRRQTGASDTILIKDKYVCTVNAPSKFRVKVRWICSTNEWTLYSDTTGGTNYISSGSAIDGSYLPSSLFPYLGVFCMHTSSTGDKYFFDDIKVSKCGGCCLPQLISNHNVQVNVNTPLQLFANTIPNANYAWSGPNGFQSTDQNPLVSNSAGMSMSGIYYVTVTVPGCGGVVDSVNVTVLNQYCDDFSDGDFTNNFTWTDLNGNIDFKIDSSTFELQSNGPHSNVNNLDTIILVTPSPFTTVDSIEWKFLVDLKFAPSSDNWVRIYLVSNQQDIRGSVNGYYIQIGQTNNDNIKFYRQDGSISTLLFTGNTSFSGNVKVRIKIFRDCITKYWIIQSDSIGGFNYKDEGNAFSDNTYATTAYFGVYCRYKLDTRFDQYFFDDFCFGKECIIGIEENTDNNGISIYPNPANNKFTFEIVPALVHKDNLVSIYNIQGQLIWQESLRSEKTEINIGSFANGIYIIRLANPRNASVVSKFIKY